MTPRQRFGQFLATARRKAGLTQSDVARALGYDFENAQQLASNWERGMALPPRAKAPQLAEVLGIPRGRYLEAWREYVDASAREHWKAMRAEFEERA